MKLETHCSAGRYSAIRRYNENFFEKKSSLIKGEDLSFTSEELSGSCVIYLSALGTTEKIKSELNVLKLLPAEKLILNISQNRFSADEDYLPLLKLFCAKKLCVRKYTNEKLPKNVFYAEAFLKYPHDITLVLEKKETDDENRDT